MDDCSTATNHTKYFHADFSDVNEIQTTDILNRKRYIITAIKSGNNETSIVNDKSISKDDLIETCDANNENDAVEFDDAYNESYIVEVQEDAPKLKSIHKIKVQWPTDGKHYFDIFSTN